MRNKLDSNFDAFLSKDLFLSSDYVIPEMWSHFYLQSRQKINQLVAVGVAELARQLLRTPEGLGSNSVIGNFNWTAVFTVQKTKLKTKRPEIAHLKYFTLTTIHLTTVYQAV